ncbi:MAG: hypothetical protein CR982_04530 [Candidatus Cloacimonadota bacterium]|nr:MAG: hypothetical protein CR982_04530 [Candidatus Cloacimonadota bacterium]PIE80069.1 MAG: hypothetical protein CSA15_02290 [Candidatus Delongbacteria bacterium]
MKLANKIILTVLISVLLFNSTLFVYRVSKQKATLDADFKERIDNILLTTIEGSKQSLYNLDFNSLEFFINTIFMNKYVKGVVFKNRVNVTIAFINGEKITSLRDVDEDKINIDTDDDTITKHGKISFNRINERVTIYFSKKEFDKQTNQIIVDHTIEFFLTGLLFSLLLLMTIRRVVLIPIKKLSVFSSEIVNNLVSVRNALAEERYGENVLVDLNKIIINETKLSNDEFGDLQYVMIDMAKTIKNSFQTVMERSDAIERINDDLEDMIEERTVKLKKVNKKLQDTIDTLQETQGKMIQQEKMASLGSLVASVAHEINTPIGIGVTAASHLEDRTLLIEKLSKNKEMKKSDFMAYVTTAVESSRMILTNLNRAAQLINSFKEIAVDQTNENIRSFNLKEYLNEVILSLKPRLKKTKHNIFLDIEENINLLSYPGAVSQIFTNLIMNSLTHGFKDINNGEIFIEAKEVEENIEIVYEDNGIGVDEETVKKIFDPFFTTERGLGGTGLGMHIVYNNVVEILKGSIVCESRDDRGISFKIIFPCKSGY